MKKKQLSKLALMGLATGAMMTSTSALSADHVVETRETYLAGGCGSKCGGGSNRSNPKNYTADTYGQTPTNAVNPNMAPKPESMRTAPANNFQHNYNQSFEQTNPYAPKPANGNGNGNGNVNGNGNGSCGASKASNGQGGCASAKPANGQTAPSHSCSGAVPSNGQTSSSCGARNGYRR